MKFDANTYLKRIAIRLEELANMVRPEQRVLDTKTYLERIADAIENWSGGGGGGTTYRAGQNIKIQGNEISAPDVATTARVDALETVVNGKQKALTAGSNITLNADGTISATDTNTTYAAGTGVSISGANNAITAERHAGNTYTKTEVDGLLNDKQKKLTAGDNVAITTAGVISATDTTYTAGTGVTISGANNTITTDRNATNTYTKTEVDTLLDDKQKKLTAGTNIEITTAGVINATQYTASDGIQIVANAIKALRNPDNTYTKAEVDDLIAGVAGITMEVVDALPATGQTGTIYLLERTGGGYEQWVYTQTDGWIDLGGEDIDLSGYLKTVDAERDYQKKLVAGTNITINSTTNEISATDTTYTAGTGITISNTNTIAADRNATNTYTKTEVDTALATKQGTLVAGTNVSITGNTIAATDTTYSAGDGITITGTNNAINAERTAANTYTKTEVNNLLADKQDELTAGTNITIGADKKISATDTTYAAGDGISITGANNTITAERHSGNTYTKTEVDTALAAKQGTLTAGTGITISGANNTIAADRNASNTYTKTEVNNLLNEKQGTLTAGTNVTISNGTISATDTTYTAGNGLSLSGTEFSAKLTQLKTITTANQWGVDAVQLNPNTEGTLAYKIAQLEQQESILQVAAAYNNEEYNLSNSLKILPCNNVAMTSAHWDKSSDGGYRAKRTGTAIISARANVSNLNVGDRVQLQIAKYVSGTWTSVLTIYFGGNGAVEFGAIPEIYLNVASGDYVYMRICNITANRGKVERNTALLSCKFYN